MRITSAAFAALATVAAQNQPAPPAVAQKLDTPQARVIVATLQPRTPSVSRNGHATNRVIIYLDDGVMRRTEGLSSASAGSGATGGQTIAFKRGEVRWVPASGPYTAEDVSDHPIRIFEVDLKGPSGGPLPSVPLDPVRVDAAHYKVEFENEFVRVLRIHFGPHERSPMHEHRLNRVVLYLNDQAGGKADETRMAAAATHTEENAADTPADRLAVEIK